MAFVDSLLQLSNAQSITTAAASTLVYDVTGAGVGNAPSMTFGTNTTNYGVDIGNSQTPASPCALFTVTTAGTGTGTVAFGIEAALNSSNSEGTYIRLATTKAWVGTTLLAGNSIILPIPPWAQIGPAMHLPRFYRFYYDQTGDGAVHVSAFILLNPPAGYVSTQIASNFVAP